MIAVFFTKALQGGQLNDIILNDRNSSESVSSVYKLHMI